jgi:hypothetical protein
MGWDGSGNFDRTHNFSADASAGINILASRQDEEWANYKAGLENCVTRDGQNSPSTDLPMAGQKHTNVGAAASVTQYLRVAEFFRSMPIYCAFGGTAEAMSASAQYALTSLTTGVQVLVSCPSINTTTSVTLGLTGAGTATVLRPDGKGPARGQTKGLHRYVHDGSNWILTDPSPILGRIMVADGSVSANSGGPSFTWSSTVSTEGGFVVSASVIEIPGGVRAVRVYANPYLNDSAASASGGYRFEVFVGSTVFVNPNWGGAPYSPAVHIDDYNPAGSLHSMPITVEYASVAEGRRLKLTVTPSGAVTTPTSAHCPYMVVQAID